MILLVIGILAIAIIVPIIIIKLVVDYAARKFAREFHYSELAKAIANEFHYEEMSKRNGVQYRNGINYDYLAKKIAEEMKNN